MSTPTRFKSKVVIDPEHLEIESFEETRDAVEFDCGEAALNDFLCTEEVAEYEAAGLGKTYLVYYHGDLVAYFTLSSESLRVEYLKKPRKAFRLTAEEKVDSFPGLKNGRLATQTEYQGRGIGRVLIKLVAGIALREKAGIRLLIVEAKPASVDFYQKCGFEMTHNTKRERKKRNGTMFLDLKALD